MLQTTNCKLKTNQGFTLIEIMLVIALMVAIGGISVPVYQTLQVKNSLDVSAYTIAQTLRRAQVLSQIGAEDSAWGTRIDRGNVTLFKGASFAGRDLAYDELLEISPNITPGGLQEVTYYKLIGEPQVTGDVTLTSSNEDKITLTINAKGVIEY